MPITLHGTFTVYAMTSYFSRLQDAGRLQEVTMGQIQLLDPRKPQAKSAIGTQNLNGCTCIMVTCANGGVIMAHIASLSPTLGRDRIPDSPTAEPSTMGQKYFAEKVKLICALANKSDLFKEGATSCAVFASLEGEKPLAHIQEVTERQFNNYGWPMTVTYYEAAYNRTAPAAGTVVVVAKQGSSPSIFVEDKQVTRTTNSSSTSGPSGTASSVATGSIRAVTAGPSRVVSSSVAGPSRTGASQRTSTAPATASQPRTQATNIPRLPNPSFTGWAIIQETNQYGQFENGRLQRLQSNAPPQVGIYDGANNRYVCWTGSTWLSRDA